MNLRHFSILLGGAFFICLRAGQAEEETNATLYESPKGGYRIQRSVEGEGEPAFIVSTKDPAERATLPNGGEETDPTECRVRFYGSPDETWLFYTESWQHHGERAQELYRRESGVKFAPFKGKQWFTKAVRNYAIKNGGFKMTDFLHNFGGADVNQLDAEFQGWSFDSSRLLFGIYGDADLGKDNKPFYVYFNTRTMSFEQTPYLREWNKIISKSKRHANYRIWYGVCPESSAPLPPATELKARIGALDDQVNRLLEEHAAKMSNEDAVELRKRQQEWSKLRDEGLKTYLRSVPKGEEEGRQLQFLADVTAARLEELRQATNEELLL